MTFIMMKKKKYKFNVEICVDEMTAVPFVNAVLFAKVRLLDGGFSNTSSRQEVQNHVVRWGAKFQFVCKMSANASTGVLETCAVRVSVRKELKGGRSFQKLGFTDLNLAEFAGSGNQLRKCLLEGYDTRHRQDNSMLLVSISMNMLSGDILFKTPSSTTGLQVADENEELSGGSVASTSSGFGSLPKKKPGLHPNECGAGTEGLDPAADGPVDVVPPIDDPHEPGHSRNSSNTSQMSKASGYSSLNSQSQHSRQSSSGDSGHIRNTSTGSGASETGSLDRAKAAQERRKKAAEEGGAAAARVEVTRVNPDGLIDKLLKATNFTEQDDSHSPGLKLFITKDGTTALKGHDAKVTGVLKQVVIEEKR